MRPWNRVGFWAALVIFTWLLSETCARAETACQVAPDAGSAPIDIRADPSRRGKILESVLPSSDLKIARLDTQSRPDGDWLLVEHGTIKGWVKADHLICNVSPEEARKIIAPLCTRALQALHSRDMNSLSRLVHPFKGVRFSPYAFLDSKANVRFTAPNIRGAFGDKRKRVWGAYDGSGDPIRLSFAQYYERFVYDRDFAHTATMTYNGERAHPGTTHDNSRQEYPNAIIAEAYVPGLAPEREGSDYRSLRLVFEQHSGEWYLVHIVHDQWTI
ncbi:MAG TPA: hypothetical protein VIS96_18725 [Terrimicrobiaceae bacterium]